MSQPKFTPGPWSLKYNEWGEAIISSDEEFVLKITPDINPRQKANARLIAAAPEMFDLLVEFMNAQTADDIAYVEVTANEIIAKVEGEAS